MKVECQKSVEEQLCEQIEQLSAEGALKDEAIAMARRKLHYAEVILTIEEWDMLDPVSTRHADD